VDLFLYEQDYPRRHTKGHEEKETVKIKASEPDGEELGNVNSGVERSTSQAFFVFFCVFVDLFLYEQDYPRRHTKGHEEKETVKIKASEPDGEELGNVNSGVERSTSQAFFVFLLSSWISFCMNRIIHEDTRRGTKKKKRSRSRPRSLTVKSSAT
jgi:hypothetical protein